MSGAYGEAKGRRLINLTESNALPHHGDNVHLAIPLSCARLHEVHKDWALRSTAFPL